MATVLIQLSVDATALFIVGIDAIEKSLNWLLLLESTVALRTYAYTVGGLLLARRLNDVNMAAATAGISGSQHTSYGAYAPSRRAVFYALLTVAFMFLYSTILIQLSGATISAGLQGKVDVSLAVSPLTILVAATFGFSEELVFRLGLQNGLTYMFRSIRYGHYWAVVVTAAFWSVGHIGSMDPNWVKIAQIFVFGLLLGQMNRRFGVVPCIISHVLFNIVAAILVPAMFGDELMPA
jgi:membrane protease YdiL (CAAX protease family)